MERPEASGLHAPIAPRPWPQGPETPRQDADRSPSTAPAPFLAGIGVYLAQFRRRSPNPYALPPWLKFVATTGMAMLALWPASPGAVEVARMLGAMVALYLVTQGALAWNDLCDVEADRISNPDRPLASGRVSPRSAFAASFLLFGASAAISAVMSVACLGWVLALMALCAVHFGWTKRHLAIPGSSEVITCLMPLVAPLYYFTLFGSLGTTTALVIGFLFFIDLSSDIAGGIRDREGDARNGVRTFAVGLGARRAARISGLSLAIGIAYAVALVLDSPLGAVFAVVFGLAAVPTLRLLARLLRAPTQAHASDVFVMNSSLVFLGFLGMLLDLGARHLGLL